MPQTSLRDAIRGLNLSVPPKGAHAGLWLDRMLPEQLYEGETLHTDHPHTELIKRVHEINEPNEYKQYVERWKAALKSLNVEPRKACVRSRLIVGLGAESVLETSIALHRTYGMPYIPGSALKGLAAAYAHRMLEDDTWHKAVYKDNQLISPIGEAHRIMFGDTTTAGYVTFFDALYVPGSGHQERALWPDIITVHHPDYYQEKKQGGKLLPPADWDSPTPISFLSATGTYLIALAGPQAWVNTAFDILALALDEMGIGAKTSSGYGRMKLEGLEAARQRRHSSLSSQVQATSARTTADNPINTPAQPAVPIGFVQSVMRSNAGSLPSLIGQWRALPESVRSEAARIMIKHAHQIKVKGLETKAWYQELQQALSAMPEEK